MPNGGPDNCASCPFNGALSDPEKYPQWVDADRAFCTLRDTRIEVAHWTYCWNVHSKNTTAEGPIYSCGHPQEGVLYPRIPWHEDQAPVVGGAEGNCVICERPCEEGLFISSIQVQADQEAKTFCCNAHYVVWWMDRHPAEEIKFNANLWEKS